MATTTTTHHQQPNGHTQQITGSPLDAPADCTIACDKGHLTAHKLVLCDHSKYLQDILSKFPTAEHPIVILTELNITDVKVLVNYMYTGELVITCDSSPTSLLRAAQILKIDSLTADDELDDQQTNDDELDEEELELASQLQRHRQRLDQRQQHQLQHQRPSNSNNMDEDDDLDLEDEDDLMMDDEDDGNHSINDTQHSRLINSIKNIYSLNQFIDTTSPPPQQQPQLLSSGSSMPGSNNTTASSSSSSGVSLISIQQQQQQHLQQQLSSHLDLQDLQDSKNLDKNNKIRCHLCNIGLSDVKCLYRHVLTRHLPEKWGYKCEFCDREFSRDDHLMRHYTTKHKNMEFNREKIRETRRLNREMAKNFHDQISTV